MEVPIPYGGRIPYVTARSSGIGGFRGTLDSLLIYGRGTYFSHGIGSPRSGIAKIGAETALRDMADRLVRALGNQ